MSDIVPIFAGPGAGAGASIVTMPALAAPENDTSTKAVKRMIVNAGGSFTLAHLGLIFIMPINIVFRTKIE